VLQRFSELPFIFTVVAVLAVHMCWPGAPMLRAQETVLQPSGDESASTAAESLAPTGQEGACEQALKMMQQERSQIIREIGQVRREIAALRQEISEPGLKEIFAGIGYIFGLAGVGFYFQCRKSKSNIR
jgi:nickel transport protein